jgi:hypothetical protein
MREAMKLASVEVDLTVRDIGGVWNVELCMVWYSPNAAEDLRSGEHYSSANDAIAEMKRRAIKYLREVGRTDTEQQVLWRTKAIAAGETVSGKGV